MIRIKFDHTKNNMLEAIGLTLEQANLITSDESHPDCMKMRFMASLLNGNAGSVIATWSSMVSDNAILDQALTVSLEVLLNAYPEEKLRQLDKAIGMFTKDKLGRDTEGVIKETLSEVIDELVKEKKDA